MSGGVHGSHGRNRITKRPRISVSESSRLQILIFVPALLRPTRVLLGLVLACWVAVATVAQPLGFVTTGGLRGDKVLPLRHDSRPDRFLGRVRGGGRQSTQLGDSSSSPSPDFTPGSLFGGGAGGKREGVFIPSTGSLFIPGWDPQAEMEGLGTYFCSGVKSRGDDERATVTLKLAVDRNGAVDDHKLKPARFTCDESLDAVHRLRRDSEAVVVGVETVIRDDPSLTVRRVPLHPDQRQPIRVVLDRRLRIPYTSALLNDRHRTLVYYVQGPWLHMRAADIMLAKFGAPVLIDCIYEDALPAGEPAPLREVLGRLYDMGVRRHVMVEGGPTTARLFLQANCVDRALIYKAPMAFEGEPVPSKISAQTLQDGGLVFLGSYLSGVDTVECWSRPDLPWPTTQLHEYP